MPRFSLRVLHYFVHFQASNRPTSQQGRLLLTKKCPFAVGSTGRISFMTCYCMALRGRRRRRRRCNGEAVEELQQLALVLFVPLPPRQPTAQERRGCVLAADGCTRGREVSCSPEPSSPSSPPFCLFTFKKVDVMWWPLLQILKVLSLSCLW